MKKLSFSVVALIASIVMLTSCLGDGGNKRSSQIYGYIVYDLTLGVPLLYTSYEFGRPIYSSALQEYAEPMGKVYVQAYVEVDYSTPDNQSTSSYYYGTVTSITKIEDKVTAYAWLDTTVVKSNEIPSYISSGYAQANDIMFFGIYFDEYQVYQDNSYSLTFDPDQDPQTSSDGYPVFDVYLRVVLNEKGKGDVLENSGAILATDIEEIKNRLKHKLTGNYDNGYEIMGFRIHTVKGLDEETGERTGWNTSENFYTYVFKDEK